MTQRLPDLIACFVDPATVPSVRRAWQRLELARDAAYDSPWSHAVLRALELEGAPRKASEQAAWIAERLSIPVEEVEAALELLDATGQIEKTRRGFKALPAIRVDTSQDPMRARELKAAWTQTALDRLRAGADGSFGYSLSAVSRTDMARLRELHLEYVRAMQGVIAASKPSECVGLHCVQLLGLG